MENKTACAVCGRAIRPTYTIVMNLTGRYAHDMTDFTRDERRALAAEGRATPNHEATPRMEGMEGIDRMLRDMGE